MVTVLYELVENLATSYHTIKEQNTSDKNDKEGAEIGFVFNA